MNAPNPYYDRNLAQQQGYDPAQQNQPYDTGDDVQDFQGTLLDPYWGNQTYTRQQYSADEMMPRTRLYWVAGALGVVAIAFSAVFALSSGSTSEVPVIEASTDAYKIKPANPGGIEIPFQDKLVFNRLTPEGEPVATERLLPPAEQPMVLALQPSEQKPSNAVPPMPLATEKPANIPTAVTKVVSEKPQQTVDVIPEQKFAKLAPTEGAVPPPVNETTVLDSMPPAVADAPPAAPALKAEPKIVETKKVAPAVAGGTRVQLASVPDKANADRALGKLQSQYGNLGVNLAVVRADIPGKGTYWRIQSQPMGKDEATRVCNSVKATGGACIFAK